MLRLIVPLVLMAAAAEKPDKAEETEAQERIDRASETETLYALGALLGQRVANFHLGSREREQVMRGFRDVIANRKLKLPEADLEMWGPKVDAAMARRTTPEMATRQREGRAFAEAEAKKPGAVRTPTGLVITTLKPGTGLSPGGSDLVRVSYEGRLIDGKVFDSSDAHGGPTEMRLGQVIPCWTEGLQRMRTGERARLTCPPSIAYGAQGRPPQIPPGATLLFEVELVEVKR